MASSCWGGCSVRVLKGDPKTWGYAGHTTFLGVLGWARFQDPSWMNWIPEWLWIQSGQLLCDICSHHFRLSFQHAPRSRSAYAWFRWMVRCYRSILKRQLKDRERTWEDRHIEPTWKLSTQSWTRYIRVALHPSWRLRWWLRALSWVVLTLMSRSIPSSTPNDCVDLVCFLTGADLMLRSTCPSSIRDRQWIRLMLHTQDTDTNSVTMVSYPWWTIWLYRWLPDPPRTPSEVEHCLSAIHDWIVHMYALAPDPFASVSRSES